VVLKEALKLQDYCGESHRCHHYLIWSYPAVAMWMSCRNLV
jgi:hypothetical protein